MWILEKENKVFDIEVDRDEVGSLPFKSYGFSIGANVNIAKFWSIVI